MQESRRHARRRRARALHHRGPRRRAGLLRSRSPTSRPSSRNRNVIFRIPTPVFGAGLIEQIPDATILANRPRDCVDEARSASLGNPAARPGAPTATATTARSRASAGRRRTSRCSSSPARPTTSRWASPTSCSRASATRRRRASSPRSRTTCRTRTRPSTPRRGSRRPWRRPAVQNFANFQRFLAPPKPSTRHAGRLELDRPRQAACSRASAARFATRPRCRTGNATVEALRNPGRRTSTPTC